MPGQRDNHLADRAKLFQHRQVDPATKRATRGETGSGVILSEVKASHCQKQCPREGTNPQAKRARLKDGPIDLKINRRGFTAPGHNPYSIGVEVTCCAMQRCANSEETLSLWPRAILQSIRSAWAQARIWASRQSDRKS